MADITRLEMTTRYPFHFGRRGVGLNETDIVLGADALFSALCYMLALLEGSGPVTDLLAAFPTVTEARTPPFRLSSLMLSADGIDLLPMPRLRLRIPNMRLETRKDIKSLAWVSHAVFQQLVQGENLDDANFIDPVSKRPYTVHDGNVWLTKAEQSKLGGEGKMLWKTQTRPRVTVDRISSRATAYSSGTVRFAEGVRL